jgi:hypothetical protein
MNGFAGRCAAVGCLAPARITSRRRARRGVALIMTFFVLSVMSVVGLALASSTAQALSLTRIQRDGSEAFNLAESGAERAVLWLKQQGTAPPEIAPFDPFGGDQALGEGSYQVTIDGADNNEDVEAKAYTVRSTGVSGNRRETVELFVRLDTFARYAYFTDSEVSARTGEPIWFKRGDVVDGPAHSNNTGGTNFHINWTNSDAAIFRGGLTAAGDGFVYRPDAPASEDDFLKIYELGSAGYRLNVNRVELPQNTDKQRIAAWGGRVGFPTDPGVYINSTGSGPAGGIYIVGDASVEFKSGGSGKQLVTITVDGKTYDIDVDRNGAQTSIVEGGNTTNLSGVPNGVIYATGNITSLKGTLSDSIVSGNHAVSRNAWTIATDLTGEKDVKVTGDLRYDTLPDKSRAWDDPVNLRAATLGVVARDIEIDAGAADLTIHGTMLAGGRSTNGGSFYNPRWNSDAVGTLTLLGGVIQKDRGAVGTFDGDTGEQKTGYFKNYTYDRRMATNPPPFFPTTGNYERVSWKRLTAGMR